MQEASDGSHHPGRERRSQWNDAFALGGEACTIAQFEKMTNLRVDHFVVVDFNGFKDMVDALGGVPVCVPQEVNDPIGRIYLPGRQLRGHRQPGAQLRPGAALDRHHRTPVTSAG